jgi:hypothetical protein
MRSRILLAVLPLALLSACNPSRSAARDGAAAAPPQAASGTPAYRFGINGGTTGKGAPALLRQLGVGWVRIPVNWGQVEPRRGAYKWAQVETAMATQHRAMPQIRVVVTLRAKSPWAGGKGVPGADRKKASFPPADLDAYYDFVYGMATRGRGLVQVWQIENEEEGRSWWGGTAEQYLALLRTAQRAIHSADPEAKIALGGFTSEMTTVAAAHAAGKSQAEIERLMGHTGGIRPEAQAAIRRNVDFMHTVLAGAGDYVDLVDIHLYNNYETIPMRVAWLRDTMRASGYEKPIWATEVGGPDTMVAPYSDEAAAQEVVKRMVLAFSSGVEKAFWLGLNELTGQGERFNHLGLVRGGQPKPAFFAYQTLIRTLGDLPYTSSLEVPGGAGCRFGSGGRTVGVLWADQGATYQEKLDVPALDVTGIAGRAQVVRTRDGAAALRLTASPVFVTRAQR